MSGANLVELQAAVRKTLTSRAFERFVAMAVENAMKNAASRSQGDATLFAPGKGTGSSVEFDDKNGAYYVHTPGNAYAITLYRGRPDASARYPKTDGVWWGCEDRIDSNGVVWSRTFPPMVCNDFGDLVEVVES